MPNEQAESGAEFGRAVKQNGLICLLRDRWFAQNQPEQEEFCFNCTRTVDTNRHRRKIDQSVGAENAPERLMGC
jgi:hypothetical protein